MDPNHWNNFNQQAYSRLGSHPGGIPTSAASLNRFDLPMLDQAALGTGIGSSLSSSMAAHTSLPQQRPLPGIPGVNYGHPMHSSMSQFLDSMNSLQPNFVGQPTYKPSSMAPTVTPPSPYNLEASVRLHAEATAGLSRYTVAPPAPAVSHMGKPLLFNTDPHTMKETAPLSGFSSVGSASPPVTDTPKNWQLSNFVPPPSNPFGNLSADVGSSPTTGGYSGMVSPEPPPAHSGSRPSTIQRNPYQGHKGHFVEASHSLARPAHSPHGQGSFIDSVLRETRSAGFTTPSPLPAQRSEPSALSHSRPTMHHSFMPTPVATETSSSTGNGSPHNAYSSVPPLSNLGPYSSFNPLTTTSGYITTTPSPAAYSSPQVVTSHLESMNYDPVSPATPIPDSQNTVSSVPASADTSSFNTMSLHNLTDMSSRPVDKVTVHDHRAATSARGSVKASPQHVVSMSAMSANPHHATANMASLTASPQHRVNMPGDPDTLPPPPPSHMSLQSPVQSSPISVGSPQVPMSMGSPQQSVIGSSTNAGPPPIPIQAVADSTTNKPKRKRGRKKGGQNKVTSPPPLLQVAESFSYTEVPPPLQPQEIPTTPVSVVNSQQYIPSPAPISTYETPPSGITYETSPLQQMQQCAVGYDDGVGQVTPLAMNTTFDQSPPIPAEQQAMAYDAPAGLVMSSPGMNQPLPVVSTPTPSTPSMSTHSYDSPLTSQMLDGGMRQEGYETKVVASSLDEEHVFMTNTFGNAFVSPNDSLGMEDVLGENPAAQGEEDALPSDQIVTPVKMKHKTKAEQKQMPLSVTCDDDDIDDEFKHLVEEPVVPAPSLPKKRSPGRPPKVRPEVKPPAPVVTPPAVKPKLQSPNSAFQSSFLSFLQGKIPETLSSVTNCSLTKKPQLPKYVPDPRPRVTSHIRSAGRKKTGSQDDDKFSDSNSTVDSKSVDVPSVTFSDDEDTSQHLSKTVLNVISNLSEDSKSDTSNTTITQPLTSQTVQPVTTTPAPAKRGRGRHKANRRGRGRRKFSAGRDFALEQEDKESTTDIASVEDNQDVDFVPDLSAETEDAPTPPPMRIKSQRRAKTKKKKVPTATLR